MALPDEGDDAPETRDQARALGIGLIDDRALTSAEGDELGHEEFAEELAWLAESAPLPANIALYGRWGSGKSSIAALLELIVDGADGVSGKAGMRYARFDAFKWTDTPLQRSFLLQIAEQLGDDTFSAGDLYTSSARNELALNFWRTLKTVLLVAAFGAGLFLLAHIVTLLLVALLSAAGAADAVTWVTDAAQSVPTALGIVGLATSALVGAAVETAKVRRTEEAPSSGEQFERQFNGIVERAATGDGDRVVVFVDELDRCTPDDVVETLDTVRTFLDQKKCIFVVAADQKVLEQALTEKVKQSTPADSAHPYYSSGSEYLDKVFHYQVSLPPLVPQRLSTFATRLVESAGGVWSELEDAQRVVTVLVPTHVTSPRRVKALLNAYSLAYRMLKRRCARDAVQGTPQERVFELAKLVCLRIEFPLFAADLPLHQDLPTFVLELSKGKSADDLPKRVSKRVKDVAAAYARGERPTDVMLAKQQSVMVYPWLRDPDDNAQQSRTNELISYLQKVAYYPDPRADLIHLEGKGVPHGLDPAVADTLDAYAANQEVDRARSALENLSPDERTKALQFLGSRLRTAAGVDADNIRTSLFRVTEHLDSAALDDVADALADAVTPGFQVDRLDEADLPGAYLIGLHATVPSGERILDAVIARGEATGPTLGMVVLETADLLDSRHYARASEAFWSRATEPSTAPGALAAVEAMRPSVAAAVASGTTDDAAPLAALTGDDATAVAEAIAAAAARMAHSDKRAVAFELLGLLLDAAPAVGGEAVSGVLPELPDVDDEKLGVALTAAAAGRPSEEWPAWVRAVETLSRGSVDVAGRVADLAVLAWEHAASAINSPALDADLLQAVRRSLASNGDLTARLVARLRQDEEQLAVPSNGDEAESRRVRLKVAQQMAEAGLADPSAVADAACRLIAQWAGAGPVGTVPAVSTAGRREAAGVMLGLLDEFASDASTDALTTLSEALSAGSAPSPTNEEMRLHVAGVLAARGTAHPPLGRDEVISLVETHGREAFPAAMLWLSHFAESADDLWMVLQAVLHELPSPRVPTTVAPAVQEFLSRRGEPGERALVDVARRWVLSTSSDALVRAIQLDQIDEQLVKEMLLKHFAQTTSNPARERFLQAWKAASIRDDGARRELIRDLFVPTATANKGGAELAFRYDELVASPPRGTVELVREKMAEALALVDVTAPRVDTVLSLGGKVGNQQRLKAFGRKLLRADD